MEILNWRLLSNPVNWAIVILMMLFAGFALHIVLPSVFTNSSNT